MSAPAVASGRPARGPGFFTHLRLLWGLRLAIGLNRGEGKSRVLDPALAPLLLGLLAFSLRRRRRAR